MRIIATGDWHLGNLFHGNPLLSRHKVEIRGRVHRVWQDDGWVTLNCR